MNAAIYARVSTADKNQNPEVQLDKLRKYCHDMSWEYVEYVDQASAADFIKRVAWSRLMKDAAQKKFDVVLVWKIDRAFRSIIHATNTLNMLRGYNIGFRSIMEPSIDTTNAMGEFVFNILVAVSQLERDVISQRVRAGLDHAKSKGTRSGNAIGRKSYPIPVKNVCNALYEVKSYRGAARILSEQYKMPISGGFVQMRLRREGISKEDVFYGIDNTCDIPAGVRKVEDVPQAECANCNLNDKDHTVGFKFWTFESGRGAYKKVCLKDWHAVNTKTVKDGDN